MFGDLRKLSRFIAKEAHSDRERDRTVLASVKTVIENQEANDENQIAIGKILFARFDNVDAQLRRIEGSGTIPPKIQVISVITAVRMRTT